MLTQEKEDNYNSVIFEFQMSEPELLQHELSCTRMKVVKQEKKSKSLIF